MTRTSRWLSVLAACWLAIPGCSSNPSAPGEPGDGRVALETSAREAGTIGVGGGSIATTSSSGVTYTLEIPPNALPGDVEIAITPVSSISNLPFAGRLEGAVQLEPSGLELLKPAVLTIAKAPSTSATEQLVAFAYEGNAEAFEPAAAIDGTTEIRTLVSHFSGAGAASGDVGGWLAQLCAAAPTPDYPFVSQMDACWSPSVARRDWFLRFARDYAVYVVAARVENTETMAAGVREFIEWQSGCEALAEQFDAADWETMLATEISGIREIVATNLVVAVAAEKSALCSQGGAAHLGALFEYRHLAVAAGLENVTGLRDEDILDGLCAEVRIPELTLADPMPLSQGTSLDARAELWINDQREGGLFRFTVLVEGANATCGSGETLCGGNSNGLGEYTQVVTRTGAGLVEIGVLAALVIPLASGTVVTQAETPLIGATTVVRESYRIDATYPSSVEPGQAVPLTASVVRDNDLGNPQPVEGAIVTFTADGGSARPTQGTTNASGSCSTEVTASDGPNRVVVDIAAWVNGVQVATRSVEAAIDVNPDPATFALLLRQSSLAGIQLNDWCSGEADTNQYVVGPGPYTLTVQGHETCIEDDTQGTVFTRERSVFAEQFSAPDPESGIITIETHGTLGADFACSGPLCEGEYAESSTYGVVQVHFRVDEPVNFEFDGTHSESNWRLIPPQFTVTRIDGGRMDERMNWDGYNQSSWDGTLEPGDYRVLFQLDGVLRSYGGDTSSPASGWWDTGLKLKLTRVPALPLD